MEADAPWLSKPDWAAGKLHYSPRATVIASAVALGLCSALLVGMLSQSSNAKTPLLALLFVGLLELLFVVIAVKAWRSWRAFGPSTLLLATRPGVIGGKLAGTLRAHVPKVDPKQRFSFELTCCRNRRGHPAEQLFEKGLVVDAGAFRADGDHVEIPFKFSIPDGLPNSQNRLELTYTEWRLQVEADVNGAPYQSVFVVPMFRVTNAGSA